MSKHDGKPGGLRVGAQPTPNDPTTDALAALGGASGMTQTRTQYQTAITVHKPRDMKSVETRILYEAGQMGSDFVYSWRQNDRESKEPDGKTTIEGLSIDGAMILIRNWGNAVAPVSVVDETPSHFLLEATFIDLETGFTLTRLYRQRKAGGPGGRMADDRKEDISFQIGQSKAQRNVIEKAIPSWLRDRAIEAAKAQAAQRYANVEEHIPKMIAYATGLGVTEAQLVARLGKPKVGWSPYDILAIRMAFKAIADKQSTVFDEFPPVDAAPEAKPDEPIETKGEVVDDGADFGGVKPKPTEAPSDAHPPTTPAPPPVVTTPPADVPATAAPEPAVEPPAGAQVADTAAALAASMPKPEPAKPAAPAPLEPPKGKKKREPGEEG